MAKSVSKFLAPALLLFSMVAQAQVDVTTAMKTEQKKVVQFLKGAATDTIIAFPLARYFQSEVTGIHSSIMSNASLPLTEKEKAVRSLVYFMQELHKDLLKYKADIYDIPDAVSSYKNVLSAILNKKSFTPIIASLKPRTSQLMASAFTQYKEYSVLDEFAVYKRVASSPEFILQFLENKPGFRYADSLLIDAAAHDPLKFSFYLNKEQAGVQEKIRNNNNIYLQEIVSISKDKNASEILPFVKQIAEKRLTAEEIVAKRSDVLSYFQLLVNTLQEATSSNESSIFLNPLRAGIKQKALAFYTNQINDLHNAADATRFQSVKGLRPEDLYYIITSCGDELYTSSYLGLYKRLMTHFKGQSADSLFSIVKYDNFHTFMRLAANYNVLTDFLNSMPQASRKELLSRFISGIETDTNSGLERAMDIADSYIAVDTATEINGMIQNELQANLKRCTSSQKYLGIRLYSILLQVLDLVQKGDASKKLWTMLGNYEILKSDGLKNANGEIVQLVLFYGDEDGVASFNNFSKLYTDTNKWKVTKNENWINIRSVSDQPLMIFANMPLDSKTELDLKAQDSLSAFLMQQSLEPTILVHRGHSYHLDNTLKRLSSSVKLAILGSCGGYNKAISIASFNPDVQVIGSKKTGSKSINDPIIDVINETLISKNDLSWPIIWDKLYARFGKDETALNLFREYFSPSNNPSIFVLKLFNYYSRVADYAKGAIVSSD